MSGTEGFAALSIAASIIQVVDACSKISKRIQEFRRNIVFEDLALQLPLLVKDIEALNSPEHRHLLDSATEEALVRVLEGCRRQLEALDKLIQTMTPAEDASKLRRTWLGVRSFGKDIKLHEIIGILAEYKGTITLHLSSRRTQALRLDNLPNTTRTFFEVPTQRVSNFVERTQVLEHINNAISTSTVNPSVVVLTGVGGQGKTQICLEYCRQSATRYKAIFWIDASSEASTIRGFERMAAKLCEPNHSFPDNRARIDFAKETLRNWPEPWLLVFDNYDLPHVFNNLGSFFPSSSSTCRNVIIVTSRHLTSERLGSCVKIDGLTEDEALTLLQSRSPKGQSSNQDLDEGRKIVKKLGYLALAIDQAAAYISIRQLPLSLFTEHYEKRKEFILRQTPNCLWEYRAPADDNSQEPGQNLSVLTTWELSFEQISDDEKEREDICRFLTQSAFFCPTYISEGLFKSYLQQCYADHASPYPWISLFLVGGSWDSFRFQDVVVGLLNLSLIQGIELTSQEITFSLHPLIKDWLQLRVPFDIRCKCTYSAIYMTASLIEARRIENLTLRSRQEFLASIDACVENTRSHLKTDESKRHYGGYIEGFQTVFATIYGQHDRHADAETLFLEALALQKAVLGQSDMATLRTMNNFGAMYLDMKEPLKAGELLQQVLNFREKLLGPDHALTLNTVNNMGNLCVMLSMFDQATKFYERTLEGRIKAHGYHNQCVVEAYNNLGEVSMQKGDLSGAERLFETALGIARGIFVGKNALVAYLMSNIALIYKLQRRYSEAIELYVRVINERETLLGPNHSITLTSMCELGDLYQITGELDEAERWYVRGKASPERRQRESLQKRPHTEGRDEPGMLTDQGTRAAQRRRCEPPAITGSGAANPCCVNMDRYGICCPNSASIVRIRECQEKARDGNEQFNQAGSQESSSAQSSQVSSGELVSNGEYHGEPSPNAGFKDDSHMNIDRHGIDSRQTFLGPISPTRHDIRHIYRSEIAQRNAWFQRDSYMDVDRHGIGSQQRNSWFQRDSHMDVDRHGIGSQQRNSWFQRDSHMDVDRHGIGSPQPTRNESRHIPDRFGIGQYQALPIPAPQVQRSVPGYGPYNPVGLSDQPPAGFCKVCTTASQNSHAVCIGPLYCADCRNIQEVRENRNIVPHLQAQRQQEYDIPRYGIPISQPRHAFPVPPYLRPPNENQQFNPATSSISSSSTPSDTSVTQPESIDRFGIILWSAYD